MADVAAVVFDLDGVLVDSEHLWDAVRRRLVAEHGGTWTDEATTAMLGMSTQEWAKYLVSELGVPATACAAVEDSTNGMRAALAAGMTLLAVPNTHFPPDPQVLGRAAAVLRDVGEVPAALNLPT